MVPDPLDSFSVVLTVERSVACAKFDEPLITLMGTEGLQVSGPTVGFVAFVSSCCRFISVKQK